MITEAAGSTQETPQKRRAARPSFIVASTGIFLIGLWWTLRPRGPELVLESEGGLGGGFRSGRIYTLKQSGSGRILIERELDTGRIRQLASVNAQYDAANWTYTDSYLCVISQPRDKPKPSLGGGMAGGAGSSSAAANLYRGTFLVNERRRLGPGERRVTQLYKPAPEPSGTLHTYRLSDGFHQVRKVDTLGEAIQRLSRQVVGDTLYWIRPLNPRFATVFTPNGYWYERAANGTLMASPLEGGPARPVDSGYAGSLERGGEAVYSWTPRQYPDPKIDIHYYLTREERAGRIKSLAMNTMRPPSFNGYRGKLYWLSPPDANGESALMCAIPDSDKPAMVMRFPDRIVGYPTGLWVEDGKLLLSYRKTRQATPGAEWSTQGSQVVALEPGSPAHYTFDTAPLPSKGSVVSADGRYLYYTVHEERKSAFDFLSENDTQRSYTCLYRTPWRPFRQ